MVEGAAAAVVAFAVATIHARVRQPPQASGTGSVDSFRIAPERSRPTSPRDPRRPGSWRGAEGKSRSRREGESGYAGRRRRERVMARRRAQPKAPPVPTGMAAAVVRGMRLCRVSAEISASADLAIAVDEEGDGQAVDERDVTGDGTAEALHRSGDAPCRA